MKKQKTQLELLKESKYYRRHFNTAPLTRDALNHTELRIVRYHKYWDDETQETVRYWRVDPVPMKEYISEHPWINTGKKTMPVYCFLTRNVRDNTDQVHQRNSWALLQYKIEQSNQCKIDNYKIWELSDKTRALDTFRLLDNMNDSHIRIQELNYTPETNAKKREYFRDIWLDQAEEYGVVPQPVSWNTKNVSTFQAAPLVEESSDMLCERQLEALQRENILDLAKVSYTDAWLRPWKTYDKNIDASDPFITVMTRWKVEETPSYKENEAFAMKDYLAQFGDEFREMIEVYNPEYRDSKVDVSRVEGMDAIYAVRDMQPTVVTRAESDSVFAKVITFEDYTKMLADIDYRYPDMEDILDTFRQRNILPLTMSVDGFSKYYNKLLDTPLGEYKMSEYKQDVRALKHYASHIIEYVSMSRPKVETVQRNQTLVKLITKTELRLNGDQYEELELQRRDFQTEIDTVEITDDEFDEAEFLGYSDEDNQSEVEDEDDEVEENI